MEVHTRLHNSLGSLTNCSPNNEGKNPRPAWKCIWPPANAPIPTPSPAPPAPPVPATPKLSAKRFAGLGRSAGRRCASGRLGTPSRPVDIVLPESNAKNGPSYFFETASSFKTILSSNDGGPSAVSFRTTKKINGLRWPRLLVNPHSNFPCLEGEE